MWSAIVGLVAVAQFWTLANDLFNLREGKRLFGVITAAGTLGAMTGGFAANLSVRFFFGANQLLWLIVVLFAGAFGAAWFAVQEGEKVFARAGREETGPGKTQARDAGGIVGILRDSRYLRTIAALLFVSVIVSTLIDYQFKAAAKSAYSSADALATFFGSYYSLLSAATLIAQVWLTGRLLTSFGLTPSLLLLPSALLAGSVSLLLWPGVFTATATRLAEASLRTSVNNSAMEILYLPIPDFVKKKVKVFLDVTIERLGDGVAAFIILFCAGLLGRGGVSPVSYFAVGLILIWVVFVFLARRDYMETLSASLAHRQTSFPEALIDYADKETVKAVLKSAGDGDEGSVLFSLKLAARLDPALVGAGLPRSLLRHRSAEVRAQAIELFARRPDPTMMSEIDRMLRDESREVQAAAISAVCAIFKHGAIPVVRPYLENADPSVRGRAIECLLRHGDKETREMALKGFRGMLDASAGAAEQSRLEAARLMGEIDAPAFAPYLRRWIREDPSGRVIREAMAAAARRKDPETIGEILLRLGGKGMKAAAREALIEFGDSAVPELRNALFDSRRPREIRVNIPRTLSKIHSQLAMSTLLEGLSEEDRTVRFQTILALEEMARRFPDLKLNRQLVEGAIRSDVMLYSQRFAIFYVLFAAGEERVGERGSLLRQALMESMERVRERVLWLLSLIYPARDIRAVWAALNSGNPTRQAHAVELLDNLLSGEVKRYSFPLYGDALEPARFNAALEFIGRASLDADSAMRMLLDQKDTWLTAATLWEIGVRRLAGFRQEFVKHAQSEDGLLRETAELVLRRL